MKTFGEILRERRRAIRDEDDRRLTRQGLADALGVHINTVIRWETGVGVPNILTAADIADFFGITLDELIGREPKQ